MTAHPFEPPVQTMEARVRTSLPSSGFAYEPKWDGFRAVSWSRGDGAEPRIDSRSLKPLLRYFPELRPALDALPPGTVVDGEVIVVTEGQLDFDALQNRLHPAASRVDLLARTTPAELVAFDLLAVEGRDLRDAPFAERRAALEGLLRTLGPLWNLTPSTTNADVMEDWFTRFESAGCDGIVAKRLDGPYRSGERDMLKRKHRRAVDVVVGGYRLHKEGDRIGSLLLGLYAGDQLHFIGHCSGFGDADRVEILEQLRPLEVDGDAPADADAEHGFGEAVRRPGGVSRWTGGKDLSWVALRPELVARVSYDQLTGDRFRHATRFEGWRPGADPRACTLSSLERPDGPDVADVLATVG